MMVVGKGYAQYSVNYDKETVAAMAGAFGAEAMAESYYRDCRLILSVVDA